MNAIVGDNGVITNAMSAKQKQGMAVLEEFLQEKYVEHYDSMNSEGNNKSPAENMIDIYSDWFYRAGSNYYVLKDYTYKDEEGNTKSDLIKIRLIRKKNLPIEIREALVGGDAKGLDGKENSDYAYDNLKDVYGVTRRFEGLLLLRWIK